MNLTDNEIITALECCRKKECSTCPCYDDDIECGEMLIGHTMDLINRLKAEIERYKGVIKLLEQDVSTAKSQARKEFVSKVTQMICACHLIDNDTYNELVQGVYALLEEMESKQ